MQTRRRLLAGLGGLGGLGALSGLGTLGARGAPPASDRKMILLFAEGGWDATYALDPKLGVQGIEGPEVDPGGATERVLTFSGIPVAVNAEVRPSVQRFFATWAPHSVVINGISMGSLGHVSCRIRALTGTPGPLPGPDLSAIVGAELGADRPVGSFAMTGSSYPGPLAATIGQMGHQNQLTALLRPDTPVPGPSGRVLSGGGLDDRDLEAILTWQQDRLGAARARFGPAAAPQLDALDASIQGAARLRGQADLLMDRLPPWVPIDLLSRARTAVTLLEAGSCQGIVLDSGERWDTHTSTQDQSTNHEILFSTLDALAHALSARDLLEQTLVVVVSEMGRAPVRNSAGGKDHWSITSALLFGGGIRGGRVVGATGDGLAAEPIDLRTGEPDPRGSILGYANLSAGILHHMGIDSRAWLPDAEPLLAL
ncbi:MAG TPA: DUF1501 domain-containing protein [Deltaproteobacteria bacterium]|nr:DUF1501 domain-containing protein [Deltaproteobacteria bacterium]